MRLSPTKLLHGLLYTAPVILLTLVACGGGGSSPSAPLAIYYTVGGTVTGLGGGDTLVLRNNGGDDKTITADGSYTFSTAIVAGGSYNATVLTHPLTPLVKKCTFPGSSSGSNLSGNVTSVNVSCATAYTIGGTISGGLTGIGLLLQNNNGDNLQIPAGATTFTFSTPLVGGAGYSVTLINQPNSQFCNLGGITGTVVASDIATVTVACSPGTPSVDNYAYVANHGSNTVSPYSINTITGALTSSGISIPTGAGPSSVAVDAAGKFAYVTNQGSNSISAYSISAGVLTALLDVDGGTPGNQTSIPTGSTPVAIKLHTSGNFAYVVNQGSNSNSISAYSIDAATGALARIDSDGGVAGNQTSIPARSGPISIAIHPGGRYAYVANSVSGDISVYSIDNGINGIGGTGALTAMDANGPSNGGTIPYVNIGIGTTPYSVAVDPAGGNLYVANGAGAGDIRTYSIGAIGSADEGALTGSLATVTAGSGPRSVAVHPSGLYAYVVNSGSSDISGFDISGGALVAMTDVDPVTGGNQASIATGTAPISISIDRSGTFAYVANYGTTGQGNTVSVYKINASGQLTFEEAHTVGTGPASVATAP